MLAYPSMTTVVGGEVVNRPIARSATSMAWNLSLLAHHDLGGLGAGEGINQQIALDGRRILWLAHGAGPKSVSGFDVSDPRETKLVVQMDLPHAEVRSNSLDVVDNLLVVAYETSRPGLKPAGIDLFDVSVPEKPRLISHFDRSGTYSHGVHAVWFVDGEYVHMASGAEDFQPRDAADGQCYMIADVRNPSKPVEVGRWWAPGTREGDDELALHRMPGGAAAGHSGFCARNVSVYPQRPDRAYIGYGDYGAVILDITDKTQPKVVSRWSNAPPYAGATHTALPLLSRGLMLVTDETIVDGAADWPKLVWVIDVSAEAIPMSMSTLPMSPKNVFGKRGGRFGAHNLHENLPTKTSWRSDTIVFGTFFNAGVRVYDLANAHRPDEIAYFVPGAPPNSPVGASQLNAVFVDDRGIVYTADRHCGGLYILKSDF